ncbi:hypothetical protein AAFC00_000909 [Neodothiora populina]|uniref:TauD/TfdA-like domain-containing protein n=1 Tax=Neodothiora populina TaxID=2781224 RepID=A0ABR3PM57_9PEZI
MAPSALPTEAQEDVPIRSKSSPVVGLKPTGAADHLAYDDVTPAIGREYADVNIVDDILNQPNADDLLRDLAITISRRGVVFFRKQDNLTNELQKEFVHRLGVASGKPSSSSLHIHPVINDSRELGGSDPEISTISSEQRKKLFKQVLEVDQKRPYNSAVWHSDIQFENVPADYTSLRLVQLPKTGGDTVWASGYEIYDRLSKPLQQWLETLTASYVGVGFHRVIQRNPDIKVYEKPRGSPENVGSDLAADHPVIRTNPVSGWKSLYALGEFAQHINGLAKVESDWLLGHFYTLLTQNHDLQVRFKWKDPNDIAIWDNRSVFHSATFDYDGLGDRFGNRAVGIGERPFLDPKSKSRQEDLAAQGLIY